MSDALKIARERDFSTDRADLVDYASEGAGAGAAAVCSIYLTPAAAPFCSAAGKAIGRWLAENLLAEGAGISDVVRQSWEGHQYYYGNRRWVEENIDLVIQWAGYEALYDAMVQEYGSDVVEAAAGPKVPEEFAATPERIAEYAERIERAETSQSAEAQAVDAAGLSRRLYYRVPFDLPSVGDVDPWRLFEFDKDTRGDGPRRPHGAAARWILQANTNALAKLAEQPPHRSAVLLPMFDEPKATASGGPVLLVGLGLAALIAKLVLR